MPVSAALHGCKPLKLTVERYDAISFDCYGTLIDWDTGVSAFIKTWAPNAGVQAPDQTALHLFAQAQYLHQRSSPHKHYRRVLRDALADMAHALGLAADDAVLDDFAGSAGAWPPFPDTLAALRALKAQGVHLAVVSNIDNVSFSETHRHLGGLIDTVITAEAVQAYKPDIAMFDSLFAALREKNIHRDRILHVAQSRFHDIAPANELGLDVVWIDRQGTRSRSGIVVPSDAEPMVRFDSLEDFAHAFGQS